MSRVLIAWELGGNYGHIARTCPVADRLRAAGHQVLFAVRDLRTAAEWLGRKGLRFAQAPLAGSAPRLGVPPTSYAEILLAEGYADTQGLRGMLQGWTSLVQMFRPDVIVADHAPTAVFAARLLGVPALRIGNGFEIPPPVSPLPSIRPWEPIDDGRLRRTEAAALRNVNILLRGHRAAPVPRLVDLFDRAPGLLVTFPELDPYGPRAELDYAGPIYALAETLPAAWSERPGPKVFAYVRAGVRGLQALLRVLHDTEGEAILCVPGLDARARSERVRVFSGPVALGPLLPRMDVAVSYGGNATLAEILGAGVPLLLMPRFIEQMLSCRCVTALGAGVLLDGERGPEAIGAGLRALLSDGAFRSRARRFAERHRRFEPSLAVERVVQAVEALAGGYRGGSAVYGSLGAIAGP